MHNVLHISTQCPSDPTNETCLTLSSLAANASEYFTDSTTLILLLGDHILDTELSIQDIPYLEINGHSSATVSCSDTGRFIIEDIDSVHIKDTIIIENDTKSTCILNSQGIRLQNMSSALVESTIFRSFMCGAIGVNRSDNVYIINSSFSAAGNVAKASAVHINRSTIGIGVGSALRGVYSNITIDHCTFYDNSAKVSVGSTIYVNTYSTIVIVSSSFQNNTGDCGGGLCIGQSELNITNTIFLDNKANTGGALSCWDSTITIDNCTFSYNRAEGDGGTMELTISANDAIFIVDSMFTNNFAELNGGAISCGGTGSIEIENNTFDSNTAMTDGGAIFSGGFTGSLTIIASELNRNRAEGSGGALKMYASNSIVVEKSTFGSNTANNHGGAMYGVNSIEIRIIETTFIDNNATSGGAIYVQNTESIILNSCELDSNSAISEGGALHVRSCGNVSILSQHDKSETTNEVCLKQEGKVSSSKCSVMIENPLGFSDNEGQDGGAIFTTGSTINILGSVGLFYNRAWQSGGSIFAYRSSLVFGDGVTISNNSAGFDGGGIHVISSTASLESGSLMIAGNEASRGGGISLQSGSTIQIIKATAEYTSTAGYSNGRLSLNFINNIAIKHGGAIFVLDETNSGTCAADPQATQSDVSSECFFQTEALYDVRQENLNIRNTYFEHNVAHVSGNSLFGGLLDRCKIIEFSEIYQKYQTSSVSAFENIYNTTDIQKQDISSDPVQVLTCNDLPDSMNITKGEDITLSVVAIDQVGNQIPSLINFSLKKGGAFYKQGERSATIRVNMSDTCTNFTYKILSLHPAEELLLYAEGPCGDKGISKQSSNITFDECTCPEIGFEQDENDLSSCSCKCIGDLNDYVSECSTTNQTGLRRHNSYTWISYCPNTNLTQGNDTEDGYITHPCPYDYCLPIGKDVYINFTDFDSQCDFNRSGNLCGSCPDGLSLIFGGSDCWECTNRWLALLILFTIAPWYSTGSVSFSL